MLVKMDEAVKLNSELKKEYENQLKLFQHLRDNYEERVKLLSRENVTDKGEQGAELNKVGNESGKRSATTAASRVTNTHALGCPIP